MNDELVNTALEWERKWCMPDYTAADNYCAILAAAVRELREKVGFYEAMKDGVLQRIEDLEIKNKSLRETVRERDEEIARLKLDYGAKWANPSLDAALNEGDGSYKP